MGITIHYGGRLRSEADYLKVTGLGRAFAQRNSVVVLELDVDRKELIRVKDGKVQTYVSSVRGIRFCIHPHCEPVTLQFDSDNYLQESTKTQYAGVATHLEILAFLREIEPHFDDFEVIDEGGFWETGDLQLLEENFARMTAIIGRMRDLLSEEGLLDEPE